MLILLTFVVWIIPHSFVIIHAERKKMIMICKNCGAALPDDAEFCGECGTRIEKKNKKKPVSLVHAKAEAKRYKIISAILAVLCLILGLGWLITSNNPYYDIDKYEEEAADIERAGIELSGTYIVGEDSELPAGRYNIYPPDGESSMTVIIYANEEDARKVSDDEGNYLDLDNVYHLAKGYKLKAGQAVVIEYGGAYFELIEEETTTSTETESTEPATEDDNTEPAAEDESGAEETE